MAELTGIRDMSYLNYLCEKFGAHFHFDRETNVWCLSGTKDGLGWETDDYAASGEKGAIEDAIAYLEEYNDYDPESDPDL